MRYRYLDFALDSDLAFPELDEAGEGGPTLVLRSAGSAGDPRARKRVVSCVPRVRSDAGEAWLSIGRAGELFRLEFHDLLWVDYESPQVTWRRGRACTSDDSLRHLLLDQALPLLAAHEGAMVLHAGCAIVDGRAVLIAGPAGTGKSTLLAHMVASGWDAAADDAAAVRVAGSHVLVRAAYAGIRLWPDSRAALEYGCGRAVAHYSDKRRFDSGSLPNWPMPLAGIYLLAEHEDCAPAIRDVSRRDAVVALLRNTFVLDAADGRRAEARIDALSEVARRTPVRELNVPHRFDALPSARVLIERELVGAIG